MKLTLTRRVEFALLILLTVGAFGVRLYNVGSVSLAEDEAAKWNAIQEYKHGHFAGVNSLHPMLLKVLAWGSLEVGERWNRWAARHGWAAVGEETWLRLPNLILGAGITIVLYLLGRQMIGGVGAAAAAFFWAFSPLPIALNRVLKEDTPLTFFMLLAIYLFWRAKKAETESQTKWWFNWSSVSFGLAFASKYFLHLFGLNWLVWAVAGRTDLDRRPLLPYIWRQLLVMALVFVLANPVVLSPTNFIGVLRYLDGTEIQHNGYKVTVSGESPTIDASETSDKGEIKSSTLEHAPLASERFTDSIPLLPGVVRGPDGLLNVKGARANESGLLVNSANVTDPVTGEYGINLPIDVVQSVQVLANPYDAEYGRFTGAITTVQTRSGGDKFRVQFQNFFPRFRKRAGNIVGIESVVPRLTFSGPIRRGRVYFVQSLEYRFVRTRVPGLRHLDSVLRSDTALESFDSHTQFDLDLDPTNHLFLAFSLFPQKLGFANLNTFNPQEATSNFRQRGFLMGIAERKVFRNQSLLESFFSVKKFDVDVFPASFSSTVMILRPEENAGSFFNRQDRNSRRYEWQEVYDSHR